MYEISEFMRRQASGQSRYPTAIQRINYPIHKGKPNPAHGKYYFVGSIPISCYDESSRRSKHYDTEAEAIQAAIEGGATRIQRADCSFVKFTPKQQSA